jgi:hypothetical protein
MGERRTMWPATFALFLLLCLAWVPAAQADLSGATVNVAAYYPNLSSLYKDGGNRVVSDVVEFPVGSFESYNSDVQVDISANRLTLTLDENDTYFQVAPFNGFVLTLVDGSAITSAQADPSSDFIPYDITVLGGTQVLLNYRGVYAASLGSSVINITTVPEPTTFALLSTALLGLGVVCLRRR